MPSLLFFFNANSSIVPDTDDDHMPKFWKVSNPQFETLWGNLVLSNGWSALGEDWPCCAVSSGALGKPNIQSHSLLWMCMPVIWYVWNYMQLNMCPQTVNDWLQEQKWKSVL